MLRDGASRTVRIVFDCGMFLCILSLSIWWCDMITARAESTSKVPPKNLFQFLKEYMKFQWDETFDIGSDTGTPVDDNDYQVPFKFTGNLTKLTLKIDRPKLTPADEKLLMEQSQRNNKSSE